MTASRATLPDVPEVELETIDEKRVGQGGFLAIRRTELVATTNGVRSKSFPYDLVDRHALDASVMLAHHEEEGRVWVWLRSSLRPPLALRSTVPPTPIGSPVLWELPAGLVERGETPVAAAARELEEELGFTIPESAFTALGPSAVPAPALLGEVHHFFQVAVDPATRKEPGGDGSPVEAGAEIIAIPLDEALAACRRGDLRDAKTELALRRFAEVLA